MHTDDFLIEGCWNISFKNIYYKKHFYLLLTLMLLYDEKQKQNLNAYSIIVFTFKPDVCKGN